ncbi:hypothetical protein GC096_06145 [Paenibacillus sp. LMG 31461]|uniref:Glycosyl hydrolase family 31 C-terminal domain-containing protein n=2 Tax=Paenibacillus plantarum TaxID=2654975 RepID=A0ABX1X6C8_9BACL|nr:hypothetical protein [Paenibacillus plantarum]
MYTQAKLSSEQGHPLVRALFFEFPQDATSWYIEDEYMLGTVILVAPLMEEGTGRNVYLPVGEWMDYQTGQVYTGAAWYYIEAVDIPIVMLVREGTAILHLKSAALTTQHLNWEQLVCKMYVSGDATERIQSTFFHPMEQKMYEIEIVHEHGRFEFSDATKQAIHEKQWELVRNK